MDLINKIKMRHIKANPRQLEAIKDQDSNTSMILPENVYKSRYRSVSPRYIWDYVALFISMLKDSYSRKYPLPKKTIIAGVFTLMYIINPIDIFPDLIPLIGFVDDLAAFAFAASLIKEDLDKYRAWEMSVYNDFS